MPKSELIDISCVVRGEERCPVCGGEPYVQIVEPWPANHGPAPWAAGCYRMIPTEHFVGVNGDNRRDAIRNWNAEAKTIASLKAREATGDRHEG